MKDLAARAGDKLAHGSKLATGSEDVFVRKQPFSRAGTDYGKCGRRVAEGSGTVLVNGKPAARKGSRLVCATTIAGGEATVLVGGPNQQILPVTGGHGARAGTGPKDAAGAAANGHPIDVATGIMWTGAVDFVLPGPMPLCWRRLYQSSSADANTGLGHGWRHLEEWSAHRHGAELVLTSPEGGEWKIPFPKPGASERLPYGRRVTRVRDGLVLQGAGDRHRRILTPSTDGTYRITAIVRTDAAYAHLRWHDGQLQAIVDSAGRLARRTVRGRTQVWEALARDEAGEVHRRELIRYELDERDDLVRVVEPTGGVWELAYDEAHRLVSERRPDGLIYRFRYEAGGDSPRCIETWAELADRPIMEALGWTSARAGCRGLFHTTFVYGDERTTVTDAEGGVHGYDTNGFGLVTRYRDPEGYEQRYGYDGEANLVSYTDRAGRITRYERDADGRLVRVVEPGDRVTRFEHGDDRTIVTRADGSAWTMRYRGGRLWQRTDPSGATETFSCDERGLVEAMAWGETRLCAEHDAAGDLRRLRDAHGAACTFDHDLFGRLREVVDRVGERERYERDAAGSLVGVEDPVGRTTRIVRDAMGHCTRLVHPDGGETTTRYVGDVQVERTTADGARWRMGYDMLLRLRWIEAPSGEHHEIDYDGIDRCVRETSFAGVTLHHRYDERGALAETIRPDGTVVQRSYDELGRLVAMTSGGDERQLAYDELGRLVRVTHGASTVWLDRDARGRIVGERQRVGDRELEVRLERDVRGRVVARHYGSGWSVLLARDPNGHVAKLRVREASTDAVTLRFERDGEGRELARCAAGGTRIETDRDAIGRPIEVRAGRPAGPGEPPERRRRYVFGRGGALAEVHDSAAGARRYELDPLGRPRRIRGLGAVDEIRYAALGTPLDANGESEVGRGGRPLRNANIVAAWDALGRLTEQRVVGDDAQHWRYRYDGFDQLVRVERGDGLDQDYVYDGLGRRVLERRGDDVTWFGWDGDVAVEELGADGRVRRVFADDAFTPLIEAARGHWRQVVTDMAGTPWLYLDEHGSAEIDLDGAGRIVRQLGDPGPLRFAGQRHDELAGLSYQRFRHYAPALGVFTTADPAGLAGSLFDVGFVPNVTAFADPLGLRTAIIVGGEWIEHAGDLGYMDELAAFQAGQVGGTVIDASQLTAGSNLLAGYDDVIVDMHGAPGRLLLSDQIGVSHGAADSSALITGEDFANRLKDAGLEPGSHIKFYSCNSGDAGPNGEPAVAQRVAETTGATVEAPQSLAQVPQDFLLDSSNLGPVPEDWIGLEYCQQMSDGTWQSAGRFFPGQVIDESMVGMAVDTASAGQTATFGTNLADVYIPLGDWATFK